MVPTIGLPFVGLGPNVTSAFTSSIPPPGRILNALFVVPPGQLKSRKTWPPKTSLKNLR